MRFAADRVTVGTSPGRPSGIAPDGRLRILTTDGETLVASGEVVEEPVSG